MPVKILLADKSITIQKVVEMLFSGRDYEVSCVSDGETALSEAERVAPDVVLVDVDLPRVDGYRFADRLKKIPSLSQTPVILMMSRDDVYDSVKGKQSGIIDNIAKPFESQELIGKVKKAVAAAPSRPSETAAAPKPAAEPRPAAPVIPPAAARPASNPKPAAPTDIFSIINEAPSLKDLQRTAVPDEEESVFAVEPEVEVESEYEVEPEVEEVEAPLAREISSALPIGAKAVEEMRAGMGLAEEQDEVQPEVVTFESFDLAMGVAEQETPRISQPEVSAAPRTELPPVQQPMLPMSELRSMAEETITRMAKDVFAQLPPVQPPQLSNDMLKGVVEETVARMVKEALEKAPLQSAALSASDVWSLADEAISKMAKDQFATIPPVQQPQVSDDKLKGMVEEAVARMAKEAIGTMPAAAQPMALPERELRSMAEETVSKMAKDLFKDMAPPIPKISEETVRRGIEDAVMKIAREVAKEVIEKVAWEVIPELAEHLIKAEIERLKAEP